MPRKNRIHHPNSLYHVMMRGNYRQNIFFQDTDRTKFLEYLEQCTHKYDCKVHLYCLMTNHIHLLVQVGNIPLSKVMQNLNGVFTRYVNKMQQKSGHLFQGRYQDKLVQDENYLLELCYYIHYNPVIAKMVKHLDDYPWSSHTVYLKNKNSSWLSTSLIEDVIAKITGCASLPYRNFIYKRIHSEEKPQYIEVDNFGNIIIKDSVVKLVNEKKNVDFSFLSINEIIHAVSDELSADEDEIVSASLSREICNARAIITYFSHYHAGYKLKDIALYFSQNPESTSRAMHRFIKAGSVKQYEKRIMNVLKRAQLEKVSG